ncbi:MAG: T9SS type A sorting domain-containing protein [Bacteroidota bacterium]
MKNKIKCCLPIFLFLSMQMAQAQVPSTIVFEDSETCLRYVMDEKDNRIVDFSYAGYKNGEAAIPLAPVVATLSPIPGDNTSHIQMRIDSVANLTPDANGIRGAILLQAGNYEIHGTLQMTASGVILRGVGAGEEEESNSILTGVGNIPSSRNIIEAGGLGLADWTAQVAGTLTPITSTFVPAGSRTIQIGAPDLYNIGDEVILFHPSTAAWLASIDGGGTATDAPWTPGEIDIFYKRTITKVNLENGKITLDVPIYDHFDNALATAQIYQLAESDIKTQIGIENLRIDILTNGELTEDHAKNAIFLRGVEDCWLSNVTGLHFSYAMVDMNVASRVTVQNCKALAPHSLIDGGRRYNFTVGRKSNNILFTNCEASEGRHAFVSNGASSVSGIVWHNCISDGDYNTTEGHRRWSQALLFDNITFTNPNTSRLLGLYNRGSFGTGHGWSATSSVAWNIKMPSSNSVIIQQAPHRQNYGIGCQGMVSGQGPFAQPSGFIEASGSETLITSLYQKQLSKRLANGAPIDAPARFSVEKINEDIVVSWLDIADNESGYVIEISYDGTAFSEWAEVNANETVYTFPFDQLLSELFYLRMYAKSETLCSSAYTYTFLSDALVGLEGFENFPLKIFPNPITDVLEIETEEGSISNIQLYGLDGTSIPIDPANPKINLSQLEAGIYFVKIQMSNAIRVVKKIIKL